MPERAVCAVLCRIAGARCLGGAALMALAPHADTLTRIPLMTGAPTAPPTG